MKCEEMIKEIYFVAGVLEGMAYTKGQLVTEAMESKLADCVDRLEIVGVQVMRLIANTAPMLGIKGMPSGEQTIEHLSEKRVIGFEQRPAEASGRSCPAQEDASDQ